MIYCVAIKSKKYHDSLVFVGYSYDYTIAEKYSVYRKEKLKKTGNDRYNKIEIISISEDVFKNKVNTDMRFSTISKIEQVTTNTFLSTDDIDLITRSFDERLKQNIDHAKTIRAILKYFNTPESNEIRKELKKFIKLVEDNPEEWFDSIDYDKLADDVII